MSTGAGEIDAQTLHSQRTATDPEGSAWVSANAGSGKTFVLSRRVIRLLLAGVDPGRILCLTFTKAAAAEMARRVFGELGRWTTLSDADLSAELAALSDRPPDEATRARARRLFAAALETPGGLKIQTIHAFCERLLHQFPLEANIASSFEILDERGAAALKVEARRAMLKLADEDRAGMLGQALASVVPLVSDRLLEDSLDEFIAARDRLGAWIVANGDLDGALEDLRAALGANEPADALRRELLAGVPFDRAEAARLVAHLDRGKKTDQQAAERLLPYVESDSEDVRLDAWLAFLFKDNGDIRKDVATKAVREAWPGLEDKLEAEKARLLALRDRLFTADLYESTVALLRLADAAIAEYERRKHRRGLLDFEDLVVRTASLLLRSDVSAWIHYKLDRGIDHILVDEAQDTSPRQWQVIGKLVGEFFAGEGASDMARTFFAVGDEKQSIFSFQGAVPAWFSRMRHDLGGAAQASGGRWGDVELHLSFRSVPKVLAAVDATFQHADAYAGLTAEPGPTLHTARRQGEPGRVGIWPAIPAPQKSDTNDWTSPVDHLGDASPEVQLARRLATTIRGFLDRGETIAASGKPIRPGGILILSRSRGALTDAINRELKKAGVPIAGADRLTLSEHIAVMDLIALARVTLLPEDDLSLAALLKSPLVGLDEDALYALAVGRGGKSLWDALRDHADAAPFADARRRIEAWRAAADLRDPHGFFARILGPDGGRRAFLARLGPEADDVLDEFLAQALAFEQANVPTLEGFVAWLGGGDTDIKRDTETGRDEVRVMTVHGAKGLEADVVFLVDNGTRPSMAIHDRRALPLRGEGDDPDEPGPLVWMRAVRRMPALVRARVDEERARAEEEYRRLLYVGLTRAKDQLYVVGISNRNSHKEKSWHALVTAALEPLATEVRNADGVLEALEWKPDEGGTPVVAPPSVEVPEPDVPAWLTVPAPAPPEALPRVSPSTVAVQGVAAARHRASGDAGDTDALKRGALIHRLLEALPAIAPEQRAEIGARYLDYAAGDWPQERRHALLAEAMAVTADSRFAAAFAPGSRGEVEIAGTVQWQGREVAVSGRIDRLAVTDDRILVVDYKTNRPAPATAPPEYVGQLALYRALLRRVYPGRPVEAAILWTDGPALMPVPAEAMDRAESGADKAVTEG